MIIDSLKLDRVYIGMVKKIFYTGGKYSSITIYVEIPTPFGTKRINKTYYLKGDWKASYIKALEATINRVIDFKPIENLIDRGLISEIPGYMSKLIRHKVEVLKTTSYNKEYIQLTIKDDCVDLF